MNSVLVATAADAADWAQLRHALWPRGSVEDHSADIAKALTQQKETLNLIARSADGVAVGFAEASLRHDYVNGCHSSPVAFLEGIYVAPQVRRSGIARQLSAAVVAWATEHGCSELASDAALDNLASHHMHIALGFEETQRVVFFRQRLTADQL